MRPCQLHAVPVGRHRFLAELRLRLLPWQGSVQLVGGLGTGSDFAVNGGLQNLNRRQHAVTSTERLSGAALEATGGSTGVSGHCTLCCVSDGVRARALRRACRQGMQCESPEEKVSGGRAGRNAAAQASIRSTIQAIATSTGAASSDCTPVPRRCCVETRLTALSCAEPATEKVIARGFMRRAGASSSH